MRRERERERERECERERESERMAQICNKSCKVAWLLHTSVSPDARPYTYAQALILCPGPWPNLLICAQVINHGRCGESADMQGHRIRT